MFRNFLVRFEKSLQYFSYILIRKNRLCVCLGLYFFYRNNAGVYEFAIDDNDDKMIA